MAWAARLVLPLTYSNVWIAVCAATLCYSTAANGLLPYPILVGLATFSAYGLNMLSGIAGMRSNPNPPHRHQWWINNERTMQVLCALAGLAALGVYFTISTHLKLLLLLPLAATLAYVMPLLPIGDRWIKLREVGVSKVFLIATVWALITGYIPATENAVLVGCQRWLFVLAITIPFDVRDLTTDRLKGVRTLPSVLGVNKALLLALLALILSALMHIFGHQLLFNLQTVAVLFVHGITGFLILRTSPSRHELHYGFMLDGTLLLMAGAVWVCSVN